MAESLSQPDLPHLKVETSILDQDEQTLAIVDECLWPPVGAVVELGKPNRDAVVREVRLQLFPEQASVLITVQDLGEVAPHE